ncbi:MAG: electron transfer flavoprotein subunit beta [Spirochaetes bacterium GWD1_61_31]|nr:MAG: electron transfer flavoprotein subunit beta [Spirochaetes bacterium GWB1_60_80]OHD34426.1 MAG: electron transfer flavoprotein subunit beta [Spirochaetes bacterium GWC1_61_12]OHD36035.1 MAG: electron transfer flavoprotein subunit beta [Spirochaetes bacterium GWD1_61_31]OHD42126.1 MAG: electron transfer flavoprotein subunit beta [Spirochaetes bacterium GWE1_60_18]OHD59249.1 MAG: electron transfer flavoprotein subunit beta [Spirochaetes bacterium GWF1_60_12]HAP43916.1 electron transfer fl
MGLNIVVLVKQVPDTKNVTGKAMKDDGTVNRAALPAIFNPEDLHALEAALTVKDQVPGSRVNVITMGPPSATQVLKDSLYRGADFVALISDRKFAGADTLATSYALKCAIEKIGNVDLVFCGRQAIDGDTAQVGPQTAEKLGMNQVTCVSAFTKLDAKARTIAVRRSLESGYEVVRAKLPVLLTFTDEGFAPRPSSARRVMMYKNASAAPTAEASYDDCYMNASACKDNEIIALWDIASIKADPESCGLAGSPTKVKKIDSVVLTAQDIRMIDNSESAIGSLVHELIADHTIG